MVCFYGLPVLLIASCWLTSVKANFNINTTFATTSISNTTFRIKTQKYKKLNNTIFNSTKIDWIYLAPEAVRLPLVECGKLCQETTDCCGFFYVNGDNSIMNEPPANHTNETYPNCYLNDMALPRSKTAVSPNVDYYEIKNQCTKTSTNPCAKGDCIPNFQTDSFSCDCSTAGLVNFNETVCATKTTFQPLDLKQMILTNNQCYSLNNTNDTLFIFWKKVQTTDNFYSETTAGMQFDASIITKQDTILKATLKLVSKKAVDGQKMKIEAIRENLSHNDNAGCNDYLYRSGYKTELDTGFIDAEETFNIDLTNMVRLMFQHNDFDGKYFHFWTHPEFLTQSGQSTLAFGFEMYGFENENKQPTFEIFWQEQEQVPQIEK
ncbi:uncharacterized protein [Clytia hemisphaerica]|uniref:Uncharacterized protein n=1 Tax=Clytia hemisphaerica TaxID=252671 RepID=A0A7M5X8N3_9CNID|eukprot:TCONS_00007694-protein